MTPNDDKPANECGWFAGGPTDPSKEWTFTLGVPLSSIILSTGRCQVVIRDCMRDTSGDVGQGFQTHGRGAQVYPSLYFTRDLSTGISTECSHLDAESDRV